MNSKRVLICIDDEEPILRSLQRCLRGQSYQVLTTTDPDEVLRWMDEYPVQVVISDFRLIKTNGIEVLKSVQEKDPRITRVILSGYAEKTMINEAVKNGDIFKYLLKPWNTLELRSEVESFFSAYDANTGKGAQRV